MKVLMINKFLHPNGGSETYVFQIGECLTKMGHQVQYFGMEHEGRIVGNDAEAYTSDMDFHGGSMLSKVTYPVKTIYSAEARRKIRKVLEDFKPDVCHLNNFNYQLTPSIILEIVSWRKKEKRNCKIIYTAHDYQLLCPNHMCRVPGTDENCERCLGGKYTECLKHKCIHGSLAKSAVGMAEASIWHLANVYRYIDTIICCSQFLEDHMDTNPVFAGKTITMHNFIDQVEAHEIPKKEYVLYFGRYAKEKGVKTLLEVCKELPDVSFVFAGGGPLEAEVNQTSNVLNKGFLQGEELELCIRQARFCIFPSEWYENCPFSVMEAQRYGTPVLAARIGGIPELVKEGVTGSLFPSGDKEALKREIENLLSNPKLLEEYQRNALLATFDTTREYCEKLLVLYGKKSEKKKMMSKKQTKKLNGTVIVTYRCNARCTMCNRYKAPSRPEEEISLETIKKLPPMYFTNITGGEPFIREDLKEIVRELRKKSDRIVISTNGFYTDRILDLAKEFPDIGIRISIEGLEQTNNEIRGLENGFQRGYQTLKKLRKMGLKDVGFGMTVQDKNAPDLVPLYKISDKLGMEFATASLHNSFYFVESKNIIHDRPMVAKNFEKLINELLKSKSPKKWFRAYFNHGLINYIYGQERLLPCDMSFDTFFIDPYGDVMPCNGTKEKEVMGNLNEQTFEELWNSEQAGQVRKKVRCCDRQCWMIGSVSPAMHKYIWVPGAWVVWHKFKALFMKKPYSMYENKIVRAYRDGTVTKEHLDKCSTCNLCETANDGLSKKSRESLK